MEEDSEALVVDYLNEVVRFAEALNGGDATRGADSDTPSVHPTSITTESLIGRLGDPISMEDVSPFVLRAIRVSIGDRSEHPSFVRLGGTSSIYPPSMSSYLPFVIGCLLGNPWAFPWGHLAW